MSKASLYGGVARTAWVSSRSRISGFRIQLSGFGFRVSGFGCTAWVSSRICTRYGESPWSFRTQRLVTCPHSPWRSSDFISQKVFVKSLCKSQFPHKFVNLFFKLVMIDKTFRDCRRGASARRGWSRARKAPAVFISFRKSTPPQNRQLNISISNGKQ